MFDLERSERAVVAALICALLAGAGVIAYMRTRPPAEVKIGSFAAGGAGIPAAEAEKININEADVKELMQLRGVGQVLAGRIVEYRDAHGPFVSVDELEKVKGVGRSLVDRIRDRVSTE